MKKKFLLSVSDFAVPTPKTGSIDIYSGFSEGQQVALQLHKEIQIRREREHPSYQSEVHLQYEFKYKNYIFEVKGRMDGTYRNEYFNIEEIKSGFNLNKLNHHIKTQIDHPYCLQLKTYGYIHWLKTGEIPLLNLHLVSSRNKKTIDFPLVLDIKNYEEWLHRRFLSLVTEIKQTEKRIKLRKKVADTFTFPFENPRQGQKELIETIETEFKKHHPMLIQAPTGLGKTIGILYPVLQEAMSRGQKVIYLTPKNSQHIVAYEAIKKLQENGQKITSMTVTAKNKLCFKSQPICNSEYCEFAKDYYTKLTDNKLIDQLKKTKNLTAATFKQMGIDHEVCPFELQMDHIANVDTIICDYNYVFSPQSASNRMGRLGLAESEKPNLVIDEFHNLPERAMGYYSPVLSIIILKEMLLSIEKIDIKFQSKLQQLLIEGSLIIENCGMPDLTIPHKITPPIKMFKELELKLREFLAEYLESEIEISHNDIALAFCNYWIDFTTALEFIEHDNSEFFTSFYPEEFAIKMTCCDASAMLTSCYENFKQIVGFSATLKPFKFYSQLSGLHNRELKTAEFFSPFSKAKRKLMIIPQLSSRYSDRSRNYPRIAEAVKKITSLRRGNYFVFFPSFSFLERVLKAYAFDDDFKLLCQKRNMTQQDIKDLLAQLQDPQSAHIVFAVQGGVLSEGVDYPGNMIIGAFIVGTPLPLFDWEREQIKSYYEGKYQAGFDYAYIYPAMAKSIQAAGRVIRSEDDSGIIVLMDNRFLKENYAKCMPQDWFEESPQEMISTHILNDIENFWKENA